MKMRIAIIAACAGTFALAQTDLAQAAYAGAAGSISSVSSAYGGASPAIMLAQRGYEKGNKGGKRVFLKDKKGGTGWGVQRGRKVCFERNSGHGQSKSHCITTPARQRR